MLCYAHVFAYILIYLLRQVCVYLYIYACMFLLLPLGVTTFGFLQGFPVRTFTPVMAVPFHFSSLLSPIYFEWQKEMLQPDSYYVVWALAPTRLPLWPSSGIKPMSRVRWGNLTTVMTARREREWEGERGKREGVRSVGVVFHDVVLPIVLSVWLGLIVRLFPSQVSFMSLHQSARQTFDLQFKALLVKSFMIMYYSAKLCI